MALKKLDIDRMEKKCEVANIWMTLTIRLRHICNYVWYSLKHCWVDSAHFHKHTFFSLTEACVCFFLLFHTRFVYVCVCEQMFSYVLWIDASKWTPQNVSKWRRDRMLLNIEDGERTFFKATTTTRRSLWNGTKKEKRREREREQLHTNIRTCLDYTIRS